MIPGREEENGSRLFWAFCLESQDNMGQLLRRGEGGFVGFLPRYLYVEGGKRMLQLVEKEATAEQTYDFAQFWALYPRRVAKADARRAWAKISPDLYPAVIAGLQLQLKHNQQWQRDGGQFIPYPATWLNGERWEDEMEVRVTLQLGQCCWNLNGSREPGGRCERNATHTKPTGNYCEAHAARVA